jgi:hypothetical protein
MSHIFISYSKQDIDFVRYLRALLEESGFNVWMDEARLTPSARWWRNIEKSIDGCGAFVIVMSPDAYESDWVEREILRAEKKRRPIYPVLLAGDPWSRLANIQYEDMRTGLRARLSPSFVSSLKRASRAASQREIEFTIETGDITRVDADAVALKYTRAHHGAARAIALLLATSETGLTLADVSPAPDEHRLVETHQLVSPRLALFVGLGRVSSLGYEGIRNFAANVLAILAQEAPHIQHLTMTIHGPGAGLDEVEALLAQFGGYLDAMRTQRLPLALERISLIEQSQERAHRLRSALDRYLAEANYASPLKDDQRWGYRISSAQDKEATSPIEVAGVQSEERPYVYVALPGSKDLDDLYYYGIQGAVHAQGLLCVRVDDPRLTDEVLEHTRQRIAGATVVIADLTSPEPNVYLQLGYAWGKGCKVILAARDTSVLHFDSTACVQYRSIKELETALSERLESLKAEGAF